MINNNKIEHKAIEEELQGWNDFADGVIELAKNSKNYKLLQKIKAALTKE